MHKNSTIPIKASKKHKLTTEEKIYIRTISKEPLIKTVLAKFLLAEVQIIVGIDWVVCALQSRKSRKFPEALLNQRFLSKIFSGVASVCQNLFE